MTSIISALIAVIGALTVAALPYVAQGVRAGRLRKEILELTELRAKLDTDDPQRQPITALIEVRTARLVKVMQTRLHGWQFAAAFGMALTIATLVGAGAYVHHRADVALGNYSSQSARMQQLLLKGLVATQARPPDDASATNALAQFDPLLPASIASRHAYNTDSAWAQGILYAALVLVLLAVASAILVISYLVLQTRRVVKSANAAEGPVEAGRADRPLREGTPR